MKHFICKEKWMVLEEIISSKVTQIQKDNCHIFPLTCGCLFRTFSCAYTAWNNFRKWISCRYNPSSMMLFSTANGEHQRETQLGMAQFRAQQIIGSIVPWIPYMTVPASMAQGTWQKRRWVDVCNGQNTRKSSVKESFIKMSSLTIVKQL